MRLTQTQIAEIRVIVTEVAGGDATVRLFGSRAGSVAPDQSMWERRPRRDIDGWFHERNLCHMRTRFQGFPIWNPVRTELSWTGGFATEHKTGTQQNPPCPSFVKGYLARCGGVHGGVSGGVSGGVGNLLAHIESHPGQKAAQIAAALGIPLRTAERWLSSSRPTVNRIPWRPQDRRLPPIQMTDTPTFTGFARITAPRRLAETDFLAQSRPTNKRYAWKWHGRGKNLAHAENKCSRSPHLVGAMFEARNIRIARPTLAGLIKFRLFPVMPT